MNWARIKRGLLSRALRRARKTAADLQHRMLDASFKEVGADRAKTIPSWTTERELFALYTLGEDCREGAVALEIGSYLGASSCYLAAGLKRRSGHLFCVDTWENETMPEGLQDTFALFQRNTVPFADIITPIRTRSETLRESDITTPLNLAFIDGDHSYEAVAADFAMVSGWVAVGGIVAFHDTGIPCFPGIGRVVGEAIARGEWVPGGVTESLTWLRKAQRAEADNIASGSG